MAGSLSVLWAQPEVNPVNKKARSIPFFNPINKYGRVFFFSWFGFFLAFWSWYAFPPLLSDVISKDLHLTTTQVSNSNIIALCATLVVRLVAGPACDRFGPRYTFAGCLLVGVIPTWLSGTAYNVSELYALRFFIGILGGSFVPCQVWCTGFFDKNIVGTANSLAAGLGNAGGGITYFIMPAVYYSLVGDGLTPHTAWRVSFVVPAILITTVAVLLIFCCEDTPSGKWADRFQAAENSLREHNVHGTIVDVPGSFGDEVKRSGSSSPPAALDEKEQEKTSDKAAATTFGDHEAQMGEQQMLDTAKGEIVRAPSFREVARVMFSPQTLVTGACYFCTFGAELSINSILGTYYTTQFTRSLGAAYIRTHPTNAGDWAAMFGLMNAIARPLGGAVSDLAYRYTSSVWAKKVLLHAYSVAAAAVLLGVGLANPDSRVVLVCCIGLAFAFFLEGANGHNFSLVPHVHPHANGVVSGVTGAMGNLGGIVFAIIFRFNTIEVAGKPTPDYARSLWIIAIIMLAVNLSVCWIRPVPKAQIGGR